MTTKDIAKKLDRKATELFGEATKNTPIKKTKEDPTEVEKTSEWSRSFECDDDKQLEKLVELFALDLKNGELNEQFLEATSGDGDEKSKIMTLHSSSLVAFLHFAAIKEGNPFKLDNRVYTRALFEVKNDVIFPSDNKNKSSNIDVLLMDEDCKHLLFLESKFTEYLTGGKAPLAEKYKAFYEALMSAKNGGIFSFKASDVKVKHKDASETDDYEYCINNGYKSSGYLGGIKQAFSHLLGIATGPCAKQTYQTNDVYNEDLLKNADSITFASIAFICDNTKFGKYSDLYNSTFQEENFVCIKDALLEAVPGSEDIIKKIHIHPKLLSYQDLFKDIEVSKKVRQFYSCLE